MRVVVALFAFVDMFGRKDEAPGRVGTRAQEDLRDGACLDDAAALEYRDAVAHAPDHIHLVRDQDDAQLQFVIEFGQQVQD